MKRPGVPLLTLVAGRKRKNVDYEIQVREYTVTLSNQVSNIH